MATKKVQPVKADSDITSNVSIPWGSWLRISLALFVIIGSYSLGVKMGVEKGVAGFGTFIYRDDSMMENRNEIGMKQKGDLSKMGHDMGSMDPMDMSMRDMGMMLEGKTGDALDKAFLEGMIPHHEGAIAMAKYLAASNKPELIKLGGDIIVAQTKEIEQMKQWMNEWGYTNSGTTLTTGSGSTGTVSTGSMMMDHSMMNH